MSRDGHNWLNPDSVIAPFRCRRADPPRRPVIEGPSGAKAGPPADPPPAKGLPAPCCGSKDFTEVDPLHVFRNLPYLRWEGSPSRWAVADITEPAVPDFRPLGLRWLRSA